MPKYLPLTSVVLLLMAFNLSSCDKCDDCPLDLSARFRFLDADRMEINTNPNLLSIVDLQGNAIVAERRIFDEDEFYLITLPSDAQVNGTDTLLFSYSNSLIDSVAVEYTFSSDSRCCTNKFTVKTLNFFNLSVLRRIKPEYAIFDVFTE